MIKFELNNVVKEFNGNEDISLLKYLREIEGITSLKDGCSGQGFCGACTVEMNGKAILACVTPVKKINKAKIFTIEGFQPEIRDILAKAFVKKGAVQCGFCTPGLLVRTKVFLEKNPNPNEREIVKALNPNFCRCTGFKKIVEAVKLAAESLRSRKEIVLDKIGGIGHRLPKYEAYERAIGKFCFVDDMKLDGMLYAVLRFSDHPRASIKNIDFSKTEKLGGIVKVFTGHDIPGERYNGLIVKDWPVMLIEGETTNYIGDVIAGVVAENEEIARIGAALIEVEYEVLKPLTDMRKAETSSVKIHKQGNILSTTNIQRGENADRVIQESAFITSERYETQLIEHAFLETECAIALPFNDDGVEIFTQSQGIYEDRKQIARILGISEKSVKVNLVPNGGAFGGKEDMTVQHHAALFSYLLKKPVKLHLSREESIRMHPKRHPMSMDYTVGCDKKGKLTIVKARIIGDTGAYASVGMKVLERAAGHATGAYHVPNVDITAKAIYTNNIPCGAMRGFGVNQVTFALERSLDELCKKGGFDRWEFRFQNALYKGAMVATGQVINEGVGVRDTLLAVKSEFYRAKYAGIACGIKNCGVGNRMEDGCEVKIEIKSPHLIIIHHGWTEMGQGVDTVAIQFLYEETGLTPDEIKVKVSTQSEAKAGMTTASRATSIIGKAIINASKKITQDLKKMSLEELTGKIYTGKWVYDQATKPGKPGKIITHYSYSYATQLVVLNKKGEIDTIYAAHDAGKIINPVLFEGQIEGAVHMGIGYALSEELELENGQIKSTKLKDLGLLRMNETPKIVVKGVEIRDPIGPYGAKGVGEIGLVPTAAAVANAFSYYENKSYNKLPLKKKVKKN